MCHLEITQLLSQWLNNDVCVCVACNDTHTATAHSIVVTYQATR